MTTASVDRPPSSGVVRTRLLNALPAALVLALVVWLIARTSADVDLWGHVTFGLDMLDARTIHSIDPYSFTQGRRWINHEWLAEIAMALSWRAAGTTGLILLKLSCVVAALALVNSALTLKGITGHPRVVLLAIALMGILPRITNVRPQLFSVVLFAALVRIFAKCDLGSTRVLLWTIPVLALWANFHGGWLVGVGTVGLWCLGEAYALRAQPRRAAFALACGPAALAATLVNPDDRRNERGFAAGSPPDERGFAAGSPPGRVNIPLDYPTLSTSTTRWPEGHGGGTARERCQDDHEWQATTTQLQHDQGHQRYRLVRPTLGFSRGGSGSHQPPSAASGCYAPSWVPFSTSRVTPILPVRTHSLSMPTREKLSCSTSSSACTEANRN